MSEPSNWWTYHGDPSHSGAVQGSRIDSSNAVELRLWHDIPTAGPVLSVPAVVDGHVYVGLANHLEASGANGGCLLKIELTSGNVVRRFDWEIQPEEGDSHGFMGMACTPAVTPDRIYFMALNGKLYCLDRQSLGLLWQLDLRNADTAHNQPVTNPWKKGLPPPAGWCSPVVAGNAANETVYVGIGEGENPLTFGFVYAVDGQSGNVRWIHCNCQFEDGVPNRPNVLPPSCVTGNLPAPFVLAAANPPARGCSVWSSIAWDAGLNRLYCATGNPSPDSPLPCKNYANGILALDAATGEHRGYFQAPPDSSYRDTDEDVDFGGSPMLFTANGRRLVCAGCKNGGFFVLDANTMQLVAQRQLLPYYNDGTQIPTVDPHVGPNDNQTDPRVSNPASDQTDQENYSGTYSTPAFHQALGILYTGVGGNNYHPVKAGIDYSTTPFLRAMRWDTLQDAWPMDSDNPRRYIHSQPPMYRTPGESGLSSPAVVNDVVFCATTKVALYAFHARDGRLLWRDELGEQTGGYNGGYGYCLGPAVWGDFVVAGALVFGCGGVLRIYSLGAKPA
jgi:outer membrane protein assembly factor BamB